MSRINLNLLLAMQSYRYSLWSAGVSILCCLVTTSSSQAQIIRDNTLGRESSQITPVNSNTDRIDGGARRGANLFHSFREFNIDRERGAYFTSPKGIQNILSRVTGMNPSNILGRLGVWGNANLFLINPNGIFLGLMLL